MLKKGIFVLLFCIAGFLFADDFITINSPLDFPEDIRNKTFVSFKISDEISSWFIINHGISETLIDNTNIQRWKAFIKNNPIVSELNDKAYNATLNIENFNTVGMIMTTNDEYCFTITIYSEEVGILYTFFRLKTMK